MSKFRMLTLKKLTRNGGRWSGTGPTTGNRSYDGGHTRTIIIRASPPAASYSGAVVPIDTDR